MERSQGWGRRFGAFVCVVLLTACGGGAPDEPTVELEWRPLSPEAAAEWADPPLQSGGRDVTIRQVFTTLGPCRELRADLVHNYPATRVLRVTARPMQEPCGDERIQLGYQASIQGLPAGEHQMRVVHITSDDRVTAERVFDHPVVVPQD